MIYSVECSFADAASEAEWNDFYSLEKLPALVSVGGFHGSQRFRALCGGGPVYLALHSVDGPEVLAGEDYRQKGGGSFARWQRHITDWHRNLYEGLDRAPAVNDGEVLATSAAGPASLIELGLVPAGVRAVALDRAPERLWLARLDRSRLPPFARLPSDLRIHAPMTPQLRGAADRGPIGTAPGRS